MDILPAIFRATARFASAPLSSTRRYHRWLTGILCLAGQAWLAATGLFAQGSLTPPGAPAPTMKTLTQVEPRTAIDTYASGFTTPYLINQPGSYYLTGNLVVTNGGNAIVIAADNVTLDLNGYFITSSASTAAGAAVANYNGNAYANLVVRNGTIRGQATTNSSNAITGGGFLYGVALGNSGCRVTDLSVSNLSGAGIALSYNAATLVERCTVSLTNSPIAAATVTGCQVSQCGSGIGIDAITVANCDVNVYGTTGTSEGIDATNVQNCHAICPTGTGINTNVTENCSAGGVTGTSASGGATNCQGDGTTGPGIRCAAGAATNCRGTSNSGRGIDCVTATGCVGTSTDGVGIFCTTATGSSGTSTNGVGLYSTIALNSYGTSTGDTGLRAETATNCSGYSASGYGLSATSLAANCRGTSSQSHVLDTVNATGCYGTTYSATGVGLYCSGTANTCVGANTGSGGKGIGLQATIGIGSFVTAGVTSIPAANKFLGTP